MVKKVSFFATKKSHDSRQKTNIFFLVKNSRNSFFFIFRVAGMHLSKSSR